MFLKMEKGEDATATEDEDKADDKQKVETAMRNSQRDAIPATDPSFQ